MLIKPRVHGEMGNEVLWSEAELSPSPEGTPGW